MTDTEHNNIHDNDTQHNNKDMNYSALCHYVTRHKRHLMLILTNLMLVVVIKSMLLKVIMMSFFTF